MTHEWAAQSRFGHHYVSPVHAKSVKMRSLGLFGDLREINRTDNGSGLEF